MRVAVVDDEKSCQEELTALLRAFGEEQGVRFDLASFSSAEAFLAAHRQERFSLVFMDIFMAGLDGVDAAAQLWAMDKKCLLIFLTSSEEFRREALSVHAFEYLLKPIAPDQVSAVLQDALEVLSPAAKYIQVISERRRVTIFLQSIVSVVTDAHYVDIRLTDGATVRSRMTIQEFLRLVNSDPRFITINKGIVVNADAVAQFEGSCCVMEDGIRLPVRVRDRTQVEQAVRNYHFAKIRSRQQHGQ